MKIGIVGGGVVGRATARSYVEHVDEVRLYDIVVAKSTHELPDVLECDLIFVCLPTPSGDHGLSTHVLDAFFAAVKSMPSYKPHLPFVIKSTVPVGTTASFRTRYSLPNLLHSPEFLTARCAIADAHLPSRNIIGIPGYNGTLPPHGEKLAALYKSRFTGIPLYVMDSNESEVAKLIVNSFFAVKIAFFNEAWTLCRAHNMDWRSVLAAVLSDGRISHSHTKVPGPDGRMGFGGGCLEGTYQVTLEGGERVSLKDLPPRLTEELKIQSTNSNCDRSTTKRVNLVTARHYDGDLLVFHVPRGEFTCTPEHLMPVLRDSNLTITEARKILITDKLLSHGKDTVDIRRVSRRPFRGVVYNLELESLEPGDDLFWVEATTGIITHNCLEKDSAGFIACLNSLHLPADVVSAASYRNKRDRS